MRHFGMVKYLVKNGANVNDRDLSGNIAFNFIELKNRIRDYNVDNICFFLQEHMHIL